ncbi:hypothetical protein HPB47_009459 [Ixodes persulcatus]|uniref:Uncharacterized protein n=1 Tax=Ixodes persulcatus TaxID=34615 RepID=A0AC60P257_IXOPE|nr:hypothetical protein HPB47_009459 [Ixodes persulcatus]
MPTEDLIKEPLCACDNLPAHWEKGRRRPPSSVSSRKRLTPILPAKMDAISDHINSNGQQEDGLACRRQDDGIVEQHPSTTVVLTFPTDRAMPQRIYHGFTSHLVEEYFGQADHTATRSVAPEKNQNAPTPAATIHPHIPDVREKRPPLLQNYFLSSTEGKQGAKLHHQIRKLFAANHDQSFPTEHLQRKLPVRS